MRKFTVLFLRPDWQWNGHQSDWVCREHVEAPDLGAAIMLAARQRLIAEPTLSHGELAPIATFEGHVKDLFDPASFPDIDANN